MPPRLNPPFDGIASVWFDSRDDVLAALASRQGLEAGARLLEDERRFIDLSRSPLWLCREIVQIHPTPETSIVARPNSSWIKLCYLLQPKEGTTVAACHETWATENGSLVRRYGGAARFARYVQSHLLDDELNDQLRASRGAPPPYAGLAEAWVDRDDLVKILGDPASEGAEAFRAFHEDERRFVDFERSSSWTAKEIVFVDDGSR